MQENELTDNKKISVSDSINNLSTRVISIETQKQNKEKKHKKSKLLYNFFFGFFNSIIPFNFNFNKTFFYSPESLGPIIMCGIISNLISGLIIFKTDYKATGKIMSIYCGILIKISVIIYTFVFGASFLNTLLLNLINKKKLEYFPVLKIYTYSINSFIPILIFSYFIESYNFLLILILIGFLSLIFFIIINILKILNIDLSSYKKISYEKISIISIEIILLVINISLIILILGSFLKFGSNEQNTKKNKSNILENNSKISEGEDEIDSENDFYEETNDKFDGVSIAIAADDKRIYPTLVFLTSLMENKNPETKYVIYSLSTKKIKPKLKKILNSLYEIYGNEKLKINYLIMKEKAYSTAITNSKISKTAYYRISLGSLLPKHNKILYLDVDIINFKDLSELFNTPLKKNTYIGAVLNFADFVREIKSFRVPAKIEVSSGVLLFNLIAYRKNDVENKIKKLAYSSFLNHHDQTAINVVCYNNIQVLPIKYNLQVHSCDNGFNDFQKEFGEKQHSKYRYNNSELYEGYYHPVNLHYSGYTKPWDKNYVMYKEFWWYYANKTKYMEEMMKFYNYNKDEINELLSKINITNITANFKRE